MLGKLISAVAENSMIAVTSAGRGIANGSVMLLVLVWVEFPQAARKSATLAKADNAAPKIAKGAAPIPLRNQLGFPTTFNHLVFTYTISPVNTGAVDVSIIGQGYNTYYLNGSPYYVPTGVIIDSTHPIVVGVVNNDGSSSTYQFSLL